MSEPKNSYGRLCTEIYEILHAQAPQEELDFYLSYARPGDAILEALCGSGRFLLPFFERGFDIQGMDASPDMLAKLRKKCPNAPAVCADIAAYTPDRAYDYIFISSGSVSLFTDLALCRRILAQLKSWLAPGGKLVFAVETVADRCPDDADYREAVAVPMQGGRRIVLRTKNHYDPATQTQYSPGFYELYAGDDLLEREFMDFQTHLYRFGEMEAILAGLDFAAVCTYASFDKHPAVDDSSEMFLFECSL